MVRTTRLAVVNTFVHRESL